MRLRLAKSEMFQILSDLRYKEDERRRKTLFWISFAQEYKGEENVFLRS